MKWACVASCSPSTASDDTVARLRAHGAELLGEVAQYESIFRLCYLRGPAGIIVALATTESADASLQGRNDAAMFRASADGRAPGKMVRSVDGLHRLAHGTT